MAAPVKTSLPPGLSLADGWTIRLRAIDPTTGADVAGVIVTDATIQARSLTGDTSGLESGDFKLVPGPGA